MDYIFQEFEANLVISPSSSSSSTVTIVYVLYWATILFTIQYSCMPPSLNQQETIWWERNHLQLFNSPFSAQDSVWDSEQEDYDMKQITKTSNNLTAGNINKSKQATPPFSFAQLYTQRFLCLKPVPYAWKLKPHQGIITSTSRSIFITTKLKRPTTNAQLMLASYLIK